MDFTKDYKNKVNSLLMEKWGYGKMEEVIEGHGGKPCSEVHPNVTHLEYMNKLDEAEVVSEEEEQPEAEFGKSKIGGQEFKKASIETGKEAGSGGFTSKERGIVGDLQKKLVAAAEKGDIVTGKALKLAKLLAAELDAMVAKK